MGRQNSKVRQGKRAVGYVRVSTARDDMHAPAMYEQQIRSYARGKGLSVKRIYADIDFSGRRGARTRPEFESLLNDAEADNYDVLIVPKLSRFGRSAKDNLVAFDRLEAAGVRMVFLDLDMDTSTAFGRMMRTLLSAMAEFESDRIADYWKDTYRYLVRAGRPHPKAPFGYRYDQARKTYTIVPAEARIVRDVFDRYVRRGEPSHAITRVYADRLNRSAIIGMLDNVVYAGMRHLDDETLPGNWKPLIDMETYEGAQARRVASRSKTSNRSGTGRSALAGLLRCGMCDRPMSRTGPAYTCPARRPIGDCPGGTIRVEKVEREVAKAFLDRVADAHRQFAKQGARAALRARLGAESPDDAADNLGAGLRKLDRKIARAAQAVLDAPGEGFAVAFGAEAERLEKERGALVDEIGSRKLAELDTGEQARAFDALLEQVADLPSVFAKATDEERHRMLGLVIKQVRIVRESGEGSGARKRIEIDWLV
jgi:DNA invertase Pin-like site-specific DNA recombinase